MDSPVLNQLFRQLFRHPACPTLRPSSSSPRSSSLSSRRAAPGVRLSGPPRQQCRPFLTRRGPAKRKNPDDALTWNRRGDYPMNIDEELSTYPLVTAKDLRRRKDRPRQVKMLTREFVDGMRANSMTNGPGINFTDWCVMQIVYITPITATSPNTRLFSAPGNRSISTTSPTVPSLIGCWENGTLLSKINLTRQNQMWRVNCGTRQQNCSGDRKSVV